MPKAPRKTTPKQDRSPEQETPAVYFRSIEVENVLCFKDKQVLNLSTPAGIPAQWTVILGDNGVGKTTLLRCLAGMELKQVSRRFFDIKTKKDLEHKKYQKFYEPLLSQSSEYMSSWLRKLELSELSLDSNFVEIIAQISYPVRIKKFKDSDVVDGGEIEVLIPDNLEMSSEIEENSNIAEQLICYGYGAIRNFGKTSLSETLASDNSLSLFVEGSELIDAEEWILQADYSRRYTQENHGTQSSRLDQVFDILIAILPDVDDIRIELIEDEDEMRPGAEFKTKDGWVHLNDLGLGYRTAIAWMVDLAVRMFRRYPNSPDPLAEPAIVLVDEIDLHLHPRWQRTIMSFLSDRFPNTQFIVTAHSPLVVQAAKGANIVLLRREGDHVVIDNDPDIANNWRLDQILTSVFELENDRPPHIEPLIKRREEILCQAHLTEADEAELKSLAQSIGSLPTAETPRDIEAMDIIRRAAKLLENAQRGDRSS
jgi:predicted ATP-binding protein involved in virulence